MSRNTSVLRLYRTCMKEATDLESKDANQKGGINDMVEKKSYMKLA